MYAKYINAIQHVSSGIGELFVVIRESQEDTVIYENSQSYGDIWIKAVVDMGHVGVPFKVRKFVFTCLSTLKNFLKKIKFL